MIKSVTATNFLGESIKMVLNDPSSSGFYIKSIDGLGPTKANINITDISGSDKGLFNSSRAETKNIVLELGFMESSDIETQRQLTYKYFPLKQLLNLQIETDNRTLSIDGYVESNEPDIFSESEGCQISILCPDPFFYSDDDITVFRGTDQLFEFVYENEGDEPVTEFGEILDMRYRVITYNGDVETGCRILIHCLGNVENLKIVNNTTREVMSLNTGRIASMFGTDYGLTVGDDVYISTSRGERSVTLYRGGQYYNIMNSLERGTNWLKVVKGDNTFGYVAEEGLESIEFRILTKRIYEGI